MPTLHQQLLKKPEQLDSLKVFFDKHGVEATEKIINVEPSEKQNETVSAGKYIEKTIKNEFIKILVRTKNSTKEETLDYVVTSWLKDDASIKIKLLSESNELTVDQLIEVIDVWNKRLEQLRLY